MSSKKNDIAQKIFGNEYKTLCEISVQAAAEDELPMIIEIFKADKFTFQDMNKLIKRFEEDTGFKMEGQFFNCQECNSIHVLLEISIDDEKKKELIN